MKNFEPVTKVNHEFLVANAYSSSPQRMPRSANQRIADGLNAPETRPLVDVIWHRNELHILFADTGVGKSILAVSLADAISRGAKFMDLYNGNEPLKVLFYDFELSDRQFLNRYHNPASNEAYQFSPNLLIDNIDFAQLTAEARGGSLDTLIFERIKADLAAVSPAVLVIDNLTFLKTQTTEKAEYALETMRMLTQLKNEYGLSILVLAHTPKRNPENMLSINDLAGSKQLSNFADSISTIGRSAQGSNIRYWKQIKCRNAELLYDSDSVIACKIEKRENMFLTFEQIGLEAEKDHLYHPSDMQKEKSISPLVYEVAELYKQGKTYDEIAVRLDISKGTITKWKQKHGDLFSR